MDLAGHKAKCMSRVWDFGLNQQKMMKHTPYFSLPETFSTFHTALTASCVMSELSIQHSTKINYILIKCASTHNHQSENVLILWYTSRYWWLSKAVESEKQVARWVDSKVNILSGHFEEGCYFINTAVVSIDKHTTEFNFFQCMQNLLQFWESERWREKNKLLKSKVLQMFISMIKIYHFHRFDCDSNVQRASNAINLYPKWNYLKLVVNRLCFCFSNKNSS